MSDLPGQALLPFRVSSRIEQALDVYRRMNRPMTANEVARECVRESPAVFFDTFRRLANMLHQRGDVIEAEARVCDVSGKQCKTFVVKPS